MRNLRTVKSGYSSEVSAIKDFVTDIEALIDARVEKAAPKKLSKRQEKLHRELLRLLEKGVKGEITRITRFEIPPGPVATYFWSLGINVKRMSIVSDMAVVHLVTQLEAFVKDYLSVIVGSNPGLLSADKTLTFDEIREAGSMDALMRLMIDREIRGASDGGLNDIKRYASRKFGLSMDKFGEWGMLVEASCRRNVIVHNRGIVDRRYFAQIRAGEVGKALRSDAKYVLSLASVVLRFIRYLHREVTQKLKLNLD